MKTPNLFIIGAPKSGTSALAAYLDEHPNVFFSNPKEPFFWSTDYPRLRKRQGLSSTDDYLKLFRSATTDHQIVGEGSTNYLRSQVAIAGILEFNPAAKFIVMLRNPVEVAHAFHSECLFAFIEREEDFETAWRLQSERANGQRIPADCLAPQFLQYASVASYASQIERLFELVPPPQRKVILFDDFQDNNAGVYFEVQDFLSLPRYEKETFERVNAAHGHRSKLIANLILNPPAILKPGIELMRRLLRTENKNSFAAKLKAKLRKPQKRTPLSSEFREELQYFFSDDIRRLQVLLNRDLSNWLPNCLPPAERLTPEPQIESSVSPS